MSSIQNLFQQAQLSEAAYANFVDSAGNLLTNPDDIKAALQDAGNNMRFSSTQATAFVSQWRVVNHIPDTASGFSATLFERLNNGVGTGEFNLAIRGSTFAGSGRDFAKDFQADAGDIFRDGIASKWGRSHF
jgi:hypothetical protein